ncbi:MAG: deoxynucleoside kinase [Candidatus Woesearchaeota archaeon]|nr:deoxynucleoside kinase [Candidatus Woesearchaeota archaeon]
MDKPFVIEFAGPPKSGKTTILERIKYCIPFTLSIKNEVSFSSPVEKKKPLKYMEWSANELINRIITEEEITRKQVIIIDCGIASQLALLDAFEKSGRIALSDMNLSNLIRKHLLMNLQREDLIIYVRINFSKEADRIKNYRFPKGSIMNEPFLQVFNESYEEVMHSLKKKGMAEIIEVDGALDPEKNAEMVNREIIKLYKKKRK